MCGIVGYIGKRPVLPILVRGLEKLEYRGYDSAGVASLKRGEFEVFRVEGKLENLKNMLTQNGKVLDHSDEEKTEIRIGLGHTRWATHGRPSETNAHPHVAGEVCVVHNGIIENYSELRDKLLAKGCKFVSETDTEIAAHLINSELQSSKSLIEAVRKAAKQLTGSYALVVMSRNEPEKLVVAKNATPVVIGVSEGQCFVASDIPAILEHTRQVVILEDDELAELSPDSYHIECKGLDVSREPITVTWDPITAEKGGYRHFMLKEIHEQPNVIADTFRGRIDRAHHTVHLADIAFSDEELRSFKRVCIVACGTAWHAALVTKYYIERLAGVPVDVDYGSEFRYRTPLIDKETLFVAISQSGETADTLGSLNLANEHGARTLAICNVVGSTVTRRADSVLYTHAGPEISVASTKAFVTQLTSGLLLAIRLGIARERISNEELSQHIKALLHLPARLASALEQEDELERVASTFGKQDYFLFLGRGILYPIALEGALKLKEISYVPAEGYPAGEMKHGPIALVKEDTPVIVLLGHDGPNYEKSMSNLIEVASRGGKIIAVTDQDNAELKKLATEVITLGKMPSLLLPIVMSVPMQLFAYHVAVYRGTDVDQPRNLAKSVTVE